MKVLLSGTEVKALSRSLTDEERHKLAIVALKPSKSGAILLP